METYLLKCEVLAAASGDKSLVGGPQAPPQEQSLIGPNWIMASLGAMLK